MDSPRWNCAIPAALLRQAMRIRSANACCRIFRLWRSLLRSSFWRRRRRRPEAFPAELSGATEERRRRRPAAWRDDGPELRGPGSFSLSPKFGPPTTSLTVAGSGFAPYALIDVYYDTANLCLGIAGGDGKVRCTFKIPKDSQPQAHWISVVQRSTGAGAQTSFTVRTDWGQLHGMDARRNGYNPYENTISAANVADLDVLWRVRYGQTGSSSSPVVWGGKVYLLADKLYAFDMRTGRPAPGFPKGFDGGLNTNLYSVPAVGNGTIYVVAEALRQELL